MFPYVVLGIIWSVVVASNCTILFGSILTVGNFLIVSPKLSRPLTFIRVLLPSVNTLATVSSPIILWSSMSRARKSCSLSLAFVSVTAPDTFMSPVMYLVCEYVGSSVAKTKLPNWYVPLSRLYIYCERLPRLFIVIVPPEWILVVPFRSG